MRALFTLVLGLAVAIVGTSAGRIVGGSEALPGQYPYAVALLLSRFSPDTFTQACGGFIVNNRAVVTAAHCFDNFRATRYWRSRVGSIYSNASGVVYNTNRIIRHGSYVPSTLNNDIAIIHVSGVFSFNNYVRAGSIAGSNYYLSDNAPVWVIGWGETSYQGQVSIRLRQVQVWVVNQAICRSRYATLRKAVTDTMWCSGYLDVGGRDACQGDSGGPVIHNNVIVGITSWGEECAHPHYPGVNVRVSSFASWINSNR